MTDRRQLFDELTRPQTGASGSMPPPADAMPTDARALFDELTAGAPAPAAAAPAAPGAPQRGLAEQAARVPLFAAQGVNEGLARFAGALPDAVGAGMGYIARGVGLPQYAPSGQFFTDAARSGLQAITGAPAAPENMLERGAQGAGRGMVDAATLAVPGAIVSRLATPGGLAARSGAALAAQPAYQAGAGAVAGAVTDVTDSPLLGAAAGLAAPLLARAVSPFPSRLTPESQRLAAVAGREGIALTPGQSTGSPFLRGVESVLARMPGSSGAQQDVISNQAVAFNRAVLRRAGESADYATPEVLNGIRARLGAEFTDLSNRNALAVTPQLGTELTAIARNVARLPTNVRAPLLANLDDVVRGVERNQIPGEVYRQIDSRIGAQMRNTSDGDLRNALGDLQRTLRTAMDRSISQEDQTAWREVRRQYAAFAAIRGAMDRGTGDAARGMITPAQLNMSGRGASGSTAMGRGDLRDLRMVGKDFLTDQVPNSGTAERVAMGNLLTNMSLTGAAATVATPWALQRIYNNPQVQNYLANQAGVGAQMGSGATANALASYGYPLVEQVPTTAGRLSGYR